MKKAVSVILIIIILINLITVKSFADPPTTEASEEETTTTTEPATTETTTQTAGDTTSTTTTTSTTSETSTTTDVQLMDPEESKTLIPDPENYVKRMETVTATVTDADGEQSTQKATGTTYTSSTVFAILSHVLGAIPQVANQALESSLEIIGGGDKQHFTIYDTVMGHYELFNISYNEVPTDLKEGAHMKDTFKHQVIYYYGIIRNISIALILFILIYIGIRMAISTLATDKAKYKKMLQSWVVALILVYLMHFIIIIISAVLDMLLEGISNFAENMQITNTLHISEIESQIFTDASKLYGSSAYGWNLVPAIFTMWILIYYQIKFFLMYIKRIIEIGFLILISPLVTVTYSIDKVGDGKAQAFKTWLTELISKASIQVVHAILYIVFIASAGYISTQHPMLAAVFFAFLSRSEKIFKNALNIDNKEFERAKVPFTH